MTSAEADVHGLRVARIFPLTSPPLAEFLLCRKAAAIMLGKSWTDSTKDPRMPNPDDNSDDIFQGSGRIRLDLLTQGSTAALQEAVRLARETRWDSLRSPHVFMGLLAVPDSSMQTWGDRLRADLPKLLSQFQELFHQEEGEAEPILA